MFSGRTILLIWVSFSQAGATFSTWQGIPHPYGSRVQNPSARPDSWLSRDYTNHLQLSPADQAPHLASLPGKSSEQDAIKYSPTRGLEACNATLMMVTHAVTHGLLEASTSHWPIPGVGSISLGTRMHLKPLNNSSTPKALRDGCALWLRLPYSSFARKTACSERHVHMCQFGVWASAAETNIMGIGGEKGLHGAAG